MLKLVLSSSFHRRHVAETGKAWNNGITWSIVANYFGLALLYTSNNYITFYVHRLADPGSYTLGKSVTPYLVAVMLRMTGDKLHELQWGCILLQCCAVAVSQYDSCAKGGVLPTEAYALIAFSACSGHRGARTCNVGVAPTRCLLTRRAVLRVGSHPVCHGVTVSRCHVVTVQRPDGLAVTATTGVWNQKVIKGFDVPINLQNMIMYSFGA